MRRGGRIDTSGSPVHVRMVLAVLAVLAAVAIGCGGAPSRQDVRLALGHYFEAVNGGDPGTICSRLADCRRVGCAACAGRIADAQVSVLAQVELGEYRFDDAWGFGLVRALVLGRGGYWNVEDVTVLEGGQRVVATIETRTQYTARETAGLPRGAVIEYLVEPLGRIHRMARGDRKPGSLRKELDELRLTAVLVRDGGRWLVESIEPVRTSATFSDVTWRPE